MPDSNENFEAKAQDIIDRCAKLLTATKPADTKRLRSIARELLRAAIIA